MGFFSTVFLIFCIICTFWVKFTEGGCQCNQMLHQGKYIVLDIRVFCTIWSFKETKTLLLSTLICFQLTASLNIFISFDRMYVIVFYCIFKNCLFDFRCVFWRTNDICCGGEYLRALSCCVLLAVVCTERCEFCWNKHTLTLSRL